MAKRISSDQFLKIIKAQGFVLISQAGSHAKFRNLEGKTVIVPIAEFMNNRYPSLAKPRANANFLP